MLGLVGGAPGGETPRVAHARALTTASAKASADCGFCPVTKLPETTTCDVHGSPLLYLPPLPERPCSFEPLKGLASFSREFFHSLSSKLLELVSTERVATRSCGGRRE